MNAMTIAHDVQVTAHQLADHIAHGNHDPAEHDQALAELEAAPLDLQAPRNVVEPYPDRLNWI